MWDSPTVTMLLCSLIAWYVVRTRMRGKRWLDSLAFLPNTIPSIMIALAFVFMFLTLPWRLIPIYGTIWIITIAVVTRYLAFGSRTMHGAILQLHHDLEEAADRRAALVQLAGRVQVAGAQTDSDHAGRS